MEILRVPSYSSTVAVSVSDPDTEYSYTVVDLADSSETSGTATSTADAEIFVDLPYDYDGTYEIHVDGEINTVDIVRPYSNPNDHASIASDIAAYAKNEEIARAIIDSVVPEGFYFKKEVLQTTGEGADYLPVWNNIKKVLKVYENNVLVYDADNPDLYDRSFGLSKDNTAIVQMYDGYNDRREGASIIIPLALSDSNLITWVSRSFNKGVDYEIVVESGYRKIPDKIVKAAELLIDDIACGRLDYYKRYITDYNTDQFKIKFDSNVFEQTGNIIVDKILSVYRHTITRPGAL